MVYPGKRSGASHTSQVSSLDPSVVHNSVQNDARQLIGVHHHHEVGSIADGDQLERRGARGAGIEEADNPPRGACTTCAGRALAKNMNTLN